MSMDFTNGKELYQLCAEHKAAISAVMLEREIELGRCAADDVRARLASSLKIMRDAAHEPITTPRKSLSGLIGGEAKAMYEASGLGREAVGTASKPGDEMRKPMTEPVGAGGQPGPKQDGAVRKPMTEPVGAGGQSGQKQDVVEGKAPFETHPSQGGIATLCGSVLSRAVVYAMAVLEVNATMGVIVAAPTAGSSGVLPGALLALGEEYGWPDEKLMDGLLNAGAIGYLLMRNASVSGAEAGCQAEVGAASAMTASAIVELMGGTPGTCFQAASLALSNLLGLVCDPIGGLVESPCQSRNSIGVANAFVCAQMALSGIGHPVPFDEMAEAMFRVGRSLPYELRESAKGGNAGTPTGCSWCAKQSCG